MHRGRIRSGFKAGRRRVVDGHRVGEAAIRFSRGLHRHLRDIDLERLEEEFEFLHGAIADARARIEDAEKVLDGVGLEVGQAEGESVAVASVAGLLEELFDEGAAAGEENLSKKSD